MAGYKLTEAINWKAWTGKVLQAIKNVSVNVGDVTVNTSDLEALQTTTNTKLDTIETTLTAVETDIAALEVLQTTANTNLSEIEGAVETIEGAIGADGDTNVTKAMSMAATDSTGRLQELSVDTTGRLITAEFGLITAQPFARSVATGQTLTSDIQLNWSSLTITNTAVTGNVTVITNYGSAETCVIPPGFSITFDCGANQLSFRSNYFTSIATDSNSTAMIVGSIPNL
tara:strand:+ start:5567 stop:6253 length:687 start_codon:yes stop_codon:yes gene_type:complete